MAVKVTQTLYPGIATVVVDFGTGRAPSNTTTAQIRTVLRSIAGVEVDDVGSFRAHEGVWGFSRITSSNRPPFSDHELALVKRAAEAIVAKG